MAEEIPLDALLYCLVECSEKAARIAQIFREDDDLFQLLVEEKPEIEKNNAFVRDFKTLADVLVQETIKRDVGKRFPSILNKIQGEEQNTFQNTLGESVKVELTSSIITTVDLLCRVLNDNRRVSEVLAAAVYSEVEKIDIQYSSSTTVLASRIGVWIDPIDSTAEYIQAKDDDVEEDCGITRYGLKCVSVLIGAYDLETGSPLLGIVNQPFFSKETGSNKWQSKIYWGINCNSESVISDMVRSSDGEQKVIVTSYCEEEKLQNIMKSKFKVVHAAGAGYKCLLVACQQADLYILSLGTTYFWDTCGPHAILAASGGGIVNFKKVVSSSSIETVDDLEKYQIKYSPRTLPEMSSVKNSSGFIAYRNPSYVIEFLHLLRESGYNCTND